MQQSAFAKGTKGYSVRALTTASDFPVAKKVDRVRHSVKLAALALGVLVLGAGLGFIMFWSLIDDSERDVRRADGIVALTGGEARIPEAVRLLAQGKARRLLISGVNPTTTRKELSGLAPNSQHLFRCCIDVGHLARDTIGNADETGQWMKERRFKSLIVVTASYHMPRSLAELRRTLPDVELIPYPVQPRNVHVNAWWAHRGTMQLLVMEYLKFMPSFARCYGAQIRRGQGAFGAARQCLNLARSV